MKQINTGLQAARQVEPVDWVPPTRRPLVAATPMHAEANVTEQQLDVQQVNCNEKSSKSSFIITHSLIFIHNHLNWTWANVGYCIPVIGHVRKTWTLIARQNPIPILPLIFRWHIEHDIFSQFNSLHAFMFVPTNYETCLSVFLTFFMHMKR
jgi:hypothetical protein